MENQRPGIKTTEFWVAIGTAAVSLFFAIKGMDVPPEVSQQIGPIAEAITGTIDRIIFIGGAIVAVWKYITARTEVKKPKQTINVYKRT